MIYKTLFVKIRAIFVCILLLCLIGCFASSQPSAKYAAYGIACKVDASQSELPLTITFQNLTGRAGAVAIGNRVDSVMIDVLCDGKPVQRTDQGENINELSKGFEGIGHYWEGSPRLKVIAPYGYADTEIDLLPLFHFESNTHYVVVVWHRFASDGEFYGASSGFDTP